VVGLYHLENTADSSGYNRDLMNAGPAATTTALLHNGYNITTSGQWLTVSSTMGWTSTSDSFTVAFWIKLNAETTPGQEMTLFHLDSSAAADYNYLGYRNDGGLRRLYYGFSGGNNSYYFSGLGTSQWHFLVYTRDGSGDRNLYLDGVSVASNTTGATYNTGDDQFGLGSDTGIGTSNANTNAKFDEAMVLNRVMTSGEVKALYNGGSGVEVCVTVGCQEEPSIVTGTLQQYKSDGTTVLPEGSTTTEFTLAFQAHVNSIGTSTLQVQVEPAGTSFTSASTVVTSTPVSDDATATAMFSGVDGSYHWRARVVDSSNNSSSWQLFGANMSSTDFVISREPVVIVPGITGTALDNASDSSEVWPDVLDMAFSGPDSYLDALELTSTTDQTVGMNVEDIIREESLFAVEKSFYGNLIDLLEASGYEEGSKLFVAPYDWRFSAASSADAIAPVIQNAIDHSSDGKIDIITHSMGGLVMKSLLNATDTSFMDKLILTGDPQIGVPRAFNALNYGDDLGLNWVGGAGLNPDEVQTITQNMPGVYDLLPSRSYFDLTGGYVSSTAGLLDYDATNGAMETFADPRNGTLLSRSDAFHESIDGDQFNMTSSNVYNIMGCDVPTIGQFDINGPEVDIHPVDGDGWIPVLSASYNDSGYNNYFIGLSSSTTEGDHVGLVNNDEPLQLIHDILDNQLSSLPDQVHNNTSTCSDIDPTLVIGTHSPVELNVYDAQGHHVGPNHTSGGVDQDIVGSSYLTVGQNSFVMVPDDRNYRIVTTATGIGTFRLDIEKYNNTFQEESKVEYDAVPVPNLQTTAEVDITSDDPDPTLSLNANGDTAVASSYEPTSITNFPIASSSVSIPEIEATSSMQQVPSETSGLIPIRPTAIVYFSSEGPATSTFLEDASTLSEGTSSYDLLDLSSSTDSTTLGTFFNQ
jgi:hypothetical protein